MVADGSHHGGEDGSDWHLGFIPLDTERQT